MELVASNEALRRRNTRLNPYLLFEGSHKWVSVHGGGSFSRDLRTWWTLINDLRTSLQKNPLPMGVVRDLLGEVA